MPGMLPTMLHKGMQNRAPLLQPCGTAYTVMLAQQRALLRLQFVAVWLVVKRTLQLPPPLPHPPKKGACHGPFLLVAVDGRQGLGEVQDAPSRLQERVEHSNLLTSNANSVYAAALNVHPAVLFREKAHHITSAGFVLVNSGSNPLHVSSL